MLDDVKKWDSSTLDYTNCELIEIINIIFEPFLTKFQINVQKFNNLIQTFMKYYEKNNNPFHNFRHGV